MKTNVMVNVCHACGVSGFSELLVYCNKCSAAEHQYCFNKLPRYILEGKELSGELAAWLCAQCEPKNSNPKPKEHRSFKNVKNNHNNHAYNKKKLKHTKTKKLKSSKFSANCLNGQKRSFSLSEDPMPFSAEENASDNYSQLARHGNRKRSLNDILSDEKSKRKKKSTAFERKQKEVTSSGRRLVAPKETLDVGPLFNSEKETSGRCVLDAKERSEMEPMQNLCKPAEVCRETSNDEQKRKFESCEEELDEFSAISNDRKRNNTSSESQTILDGECQVSVKKMSNKPSFAADQSHLFARPIIYYIWRGCLDIGGEEYRPVAAHMSTLACEKVWECAKDLPDTLQLKKLPRSSAWPKSFEKTPSEECIALYLFPHEDRIEEPYQQLVINGLGEDFVLLIVLEEVEFIVFSSVLLPERSRRFHGNYFLCGSFRTKRPPSSSTEVSCLNPPEQAPAELAVDEQMMRMSEKTERAVGQHSDCSVVSENLPYPDKDGVCSSSANHVARNLSSTCREGLRSVASPTEGSYVTLDEVLAEITVEKGRMKHLVDACSLTVGSCQISMQSQYGDLPGKLKSKESEMSLAVGETGGDDKLILPDWSNAISEFCEPRDSSEMGTDKLILPHHQRTAILEICKPRKSPMKLKSKESEILMAVAETRDNKPISPDHRSNAILEFCEPGESTEKLKHKEHGVLVAAAETGDGDKLILPDHQSTGILEFRESGKSFQKSKSKESGVSMAVAETGDELILTEHRSICEPGDSPEKSKHKKSEISLAVAELGDDGQTTAISRSCELEEPDNHIAGKKQRSCESTGTANDNKSGNMEASFGSVIPKYCEASKRSP